MRKNERAALLQCAKASESGLITLGVSLAILMLSTLVVFNVSNAVLMEQKIFNNEARAKHAFAAAEAGMTTAQRYIEEDPDADGNGTAGPIFDTDGDGVHEATDSNTATIGTATVTVSLADVSADADMTAFVITSVGLSDDKSTTRTISQRLVTINPLPNPPDNPLITKAGVVITGSASVHNSEGHSTIWSGADVDMGSNNSTKTQVPDATKTTATSTSSGYPSCMDTPMSCELTDASTRVLKGVDVIENDSSLSSLTEDDFFQNFFGTSPATYRASMVTIETTGADFEVDADLATHEVIWVEGDATLSGVTVGCTTSVTGNNTCATANTKPSILIVDGNLSFSGTPQFYGIVFVTGNVSISGNTTIVGSLVVAGTATSSTGGSLDLWFNSDVLAGTAKAGASSGSAGTWRDF
jgi:Tfp pilus assembly protein PilX